MSIRHRLNNLEKRSPGRAASERPSTMDQFVKELQRIEAEAGRSIGSMSGDDARALPERTFQNARQLTRETLLACIEQREGRGIRGDSPTP